MDTTAGRISDRSTRHTSRRLIGLAVAGLVLLTVAGCGSGGESASPSGGMAADSAAVGNTGSAARAPSPAGPQAESQVDAVVQQRAVISTGSVVLSSGDVGDARSRVGAIVTREGGRVADENTQTDRHGTVTSSHLVIRVPSARFDETMAALANVATLRSSSRKAEDVTTQVIDVQARIAAQQAGVRRLRQLVSRAGDLRALLAVEQALTVRQGNLESLMRQRAYLADETSLATINVDISRRTTTPPPATHAGGFLGGLQHGWSALTAGVNGFLVGFGALLPFAILVLVLGVPTWFVVRRLRRPHDHQEPADPEAV
jgi:hypothetical protein